MQRLADRNYRLNRFSSWLGGATLAYLMLCGLVREFYPPFLPHLRPFSAISIYMLLLSFLVHLVASLLYRRRLRALTTALKDDMRAIGPLAQICHRKAHSSVVNPAVESLLSLLPRMEPSDCRGLSDSQMKALLALLDISGDTFDPPRLKRSLFYRSFAAIFDAKAQDENRMDKLPRVVLRALARAGDSRAIGAVKRIAGSKLVHPLQRDARECLAVLEEEAPERDKQRFLLLPSSEHTTQETLLRPTAPQADTQPELLLRGSNERTKP